jgi:hypothetical protein
MCSSSTRDKEFDMGRLAGSIRTSLLSLAILLLPPALSAHISPSVTVVARGEFLRQSLPGAAHFFEKRMLISGPQVASLRRETGWVPSEENTKVYVGRDARGELVGTVIFLWLSSQHGPVGLGVGFAPDGRIRRVAVTDMGSEPLAWVRPLIDAGGLAAFETLAPGAAPDASRIAPAVSGAMSRYYARVIAGGVARAQALERVVAAKE